MDAFGVYTEVMIRWMERLSKGQPCLILGDGSQTMDFVYVDDVARANIMAATSSVTDDVINIASGAETSLTELAEHSVASWEWISLRNTVLLAKQLPYGVGLLT